MSGSGGYTYSYADRERDARRALRAELAELRFRHTGVRTRLGRLSCDTVPRRLEEPAENADSTELAQAVARARTVVEEAEQRADGLQTERLLAGMKAPPRGSPRPAARTEPEGRVVHPDLDRSLRSARARAERLLREEGPRCDPGDIDELASLAGEIERAATPELVRQALSRLEHRTGDLVLACRRRREEEIDRARLRTLAAEAPSGSRDGLLAAIDGGTDLEHARKLVEKAVADADRARTPADVAAAAAQALRAIGCDVGDDFATVLVASRKAVVPLSDKWDAQRYRLLVRLDPREQRILTTVVRNPAYAGDEREDIAAQRLYCDEGLQERFLAGLVAGGASARQYLRVEPGMLPVQPAPAESWAGRKSRPPRQEERRRER